MDIVFEVVGYRRVLHGEHDEGHDAHEGEHYPCAVHKEVLEVAQDIAVLLLGRADALAGGGEGNQEEGDAEDTKQRHRILVALRLIDDAVVAPCSEPFDEIERGTRDDELPDVGGDKAVGVQPRTLVGVVGHDRPKGRIGEVDEGIGGAQQEARDEGIDELARVAEIRRGERHDGKDSIGHGAEQQVGAELAPARFGAVGDNAHDGVHDRIPDTADEHDDACHSGREPVDVGVEYQQPETDQVPDKVGGGVAKAVAELLFYAEFHRIGVVNL